MDGRSVGNKDGPVGLQGVGDGVPLVALERREDKLERAIEVEPRIDDQAAADHEVERLEEVVQPGRLGIADQCQDGPSLVGVGLELGHFVGFERALRAGDDQQGQVVGDRVAIEVELDWLAADGGQPGPPDADALGGGVEVRR